MDEDQINILKQILNECNKLSEALQEHSIDFHQQPSFLERDSFEPPLLELPPFYHGQDDSQCQRLVQIYEKTSEKLNQALLKVWGELPSNSYEDGLHKLLHSIAIRSRKDVHLDILRLFKERMYEEELNNDENHSEPDSEFEKGELKLEFSSDEDKEEEEVIKKGNKCRKIPSKRYSDETVQVLSKVYEKKKHLTTKERERLAETLQIKSRQITVWFQNRRSRDEKHPLHPRTLIRRGEGGENEEYDQESKSEKMKEEENTLPIITPQNDLLGSSFVKMEKNDNEQDGEFEWEFEQTNQFKENQTYQEEEEDVIERIDRDIAQLNVFTQNQNQIEGTTNHGRMHSSLYSTIQQEKQPFYSTPPTYKTMMDNNAFLYPNQSMPFNTFTQTTKEESTQIDLSLLDLPFDDFMNFDFNSVLNIV